MGSLSRGRYLTPIYQFKVPAKNETKKLIFYKLLEEIRGTKEYKYIIRAL